MNRILPLPSRPRTLIVADSFARIPFTTPDERQNHPDEGDRYVPLRHAAAKLLAIPLLWPAVVIFGFKVPLPYVIFYGGFLWVPATMFCLLSWLMNRRPERYFVRFAFMLEVVVAVVAIAIATKL